MNIINDKMKNKEPKWSKKVTALISIAAIIFVGFFLSLGYYMAHFSPEIWSSVHGALAVTSIVSLSLFAALHARKNKDAGE